MAQHIKTTKQSKEYSLWQAMARAWELYRLHVRTILPISILLYGMVDMGIYFLGTTGMEISGTMTGIVYAIIEMQLILVVYHLLAKNTRVSAFGPLQMDKETTSRAYKTFALNFILVSLSVFLLVIPAIIFSVWWAFCVFIALDSTIGGMDALKKSKEMVKGRFWKIFWASTGKNFFLLSTTLLPTLFITYPLAAEIASSLAGAIIAPYFFTLFYVIYRNVQQTIAPKLPQHDVAPV